MGSFTIHRIRISLSGKQVLQQYSQGLIRTANIAITFLFHAAVYLRVDKYVAAHLLSLLVDQVFNSLARVNNTMKRNIIILYRNNIIYFILFHVEKLQ